MISAGRPKRLKRSTAISGFLGSADPRTILRRELIAVLDSDVFLAGKQFAREKLWI